MSFFFGINFNDLKSNITIPRFQNFGKRNNELKVYSYQISAQSWKITRVHCDFDENFYYLNENDIDNRKIFFLASSKEVLNYQYNVLQKFNDFTTTKPAFRSNFKVMNSNHGFSSYQSEYPFAMTNKNGSIISSLFALTNKSSDNNFVIFRNIFHEPIEMPFKMYVVDMKNNRVIEKFKLITNQTSLIKLSKKHLGTDCYLVSEKFIGIPQYLSEKNNHLSFEHTHPPHEYIQSNDRFKQVNKLKKQALDIIIKENI
jgi:hypothetical protein